MDEFKGSLSREDIRTLNENEKDKDSKNHGSCQSREDNCVGQDVSTEASSESKED